MEVCPSVLCVFAVALLIHQVLGDSCGGDITAESGVIRSPGYPSYYGNNLDCTWTITVPEGYNIRLQFQDFQLEDNNCRFDFLEVSDIIRTKSHILDTYCGSDVPSPIYSTSNKMSVRLVTDHSNKYRGFAAEFQKVSATTIATESGKKCPIKSEKWNDYGGEICYFVEENEEADWNEALYKCFRAGGSLASFHSSEEVRRILPYLPQSWYFIGLRQDGEGTFEWADKSALDFENWAPGDPKGGDEMCGFMRQTDKFYDGFCNIKGKYICSAAKTLPAPELPKVCPPRSDKWKDLGGKFCYIVEVTSSYTYSDALNRCIKEGGSLASFHSAVEVSLILHEVQGSSRDVFIGLQRSATHPDSLEWTDHSAVDFVNWYYQNPVRETCTKMHTASVGSRTDGKWVNVRCDEEFGYVCSVPKEITCFADTCKNGGACIKDIANGTFRCSCSHGYKGLTCEEKILCSQDICKNRGNCTQDGVDGVFRCSCTHGYVGNTCQETFILSTDGSENTGLKHVAVIAVSIIIVLLVSALVFFLARKFWKRKVSTSYDKIGLSTR